jgi:hypothetical protein
MNLKRCDHANLPFRYVFFVFRQFDVSPGIGGDAPGKLVHSRCSFLYPLFRQLKNLINVKPEISREPQHRGAARLKLIVFQLGDVGTGHADLARQVRFGDPFSIRHCLTLCVITITTVTLWGIA